MAPRQDRRLAAVMAVDVVGYSRLVGADEAGTLARVKAHRVEFAEPEIAEYRGRIVKLTGDGALVEFASAVDAVECAVTIQRGMAEREGGEPEERRICFRIGINIGDIIIEDGDIYGDGVNIAVRLEGLAEPGGICIARNVYNQVKSKLAFGFEPMGEQRVKNITEPIEVYRVGLGLGTALAKSSRSRWWPVAAAIAALAIGSGGAAWWYAAGQPELHHLRGTAATGVARAGAALPLPDKPSIAVLPFDNLTKGAEHEHLADGVAAGIITDLSRFRDLFVIARDSSFFYKDKDERPDVRQIAIDLGVHYVLEGKFQADDNRVRVTVGLIDASSGSYVWSESYEQPIDDIFTVQDEVTNKIAGSLAGWHGVVARIGREVARRKPPANLEAYEYYTLGMEATHKLNKEGYEGALQLFQKALELDPNYARPYVGIAWAHNIAHDNDWGPSKRASLEMWFEAAKRATDLDPVDGEAHMVLGWYYLYTRDFARAQSAIEKAVNLNPNDADTLIHAAGVLSWFGEPERAVELAERAMRLNPHFPDLYYGPARDAYFHAGHFEKALLASNTRRNISFWDLVYRPLSYAQLDRKEEAATAAAQLLEREPDYSAEKFLSDNGTYARDTELNLFLNSHEKAGLPLCATEEQLAGYPEMHRLERCEQQRASG